MECKMKNESKLDIVVEYQKRNGEYRPINILVICRSCGTLVIKNYYDARISHADEINSALKLHFN